MVLHSKLHHAHRTDRANEPVAKTANIYAQEATKNDSDRGFVRHNQNVARGHRP